MYISIVNLMINVALNLVLINLWGVNGLALATTLSAVITFFVRLKYAEKHIKLDNRKMLVTAIKVLVASAIACMIPRVVFWTYPVNRYLTLILSAAIGVVVYLIIVRLLKITEIRDLTNILESKLRKE